MLLYAIIGAVVCGIIMAVANSNAKKGVAWGMPVAVIFGVLAIACSGWALCLQIFGKTEGQLTADKWMVVRGTGAGKWVKANWGDKKLLVIKGHAFEGRTDVQADAFQKAVDGMSVETFEMPAPKSPEETGGMPLEMMLGPGGGRLTGKVKKMAEAEAKEIQSAIESKVSADSYDMVVFCTSVPEFLYLKSTGLTPIKAFNKKDMFFFYPPSMGMDPRRMKMPKEVLGYINDKSLSNPDDYDKPPQGDQEQDFNTRYEITVPPTARKK